MKAGRWTTAITAAAGVAAVAVIVASCSNQVGRSPVAPGVTSNLAANISPEPSPAPSPTPPSGTPCSPGFWKNHLAAFNASCDAAVALDGSDQFNSCADLLTALTCKGADAGCGRSAAAALLNTVSGCTE